jgi:DNA-binding NarL/FixJ family response regulator
MAVTVLIVDDSEGFRRSARLLLQDDGFDIVGEAHDGSTALARVQELQPEVVLLDVQLDGEDGFDVAASLSARPDAPAVVMVSTRDARSYAPRLAATPARGFIAKAELSGEALAALLA